MGGVKKDPNNIWSMRYKEDMQETLQIRLSKEQKQIFKTRAEEDGITVNQLIKARKTLWY